MLSSTPLRRISQGSLRQSYIASEPANHSATLGLDHLSHSFAQLTDELDTLHTNNQHMATLSKQLAEFNEGFAGFLFGLRMNAFSVEFPQAPSDLSYAMHANQPPPEPVPAPAPVYIPSASYTGISSEANAADMTYMTHHSQYSFATEPDPPRTIAKPGASSARGSSSARARGRGRGAGGVGGGVAARKAKEAKINAMIEILPLEFRGSQPALSQAMERVISSLMESPQGKKMADIVKPDLPQMKVNRCLIALVAKKMVVKLNEAGVTNYQLVG